MSGKYALVIANTDYGDPALAQLTAPGKDAEDFARVLRDKEIAAFDDVKVLLNNSEPQVREAIDEFFDQKKRDDLLILYFSGHGVRDEVGSLYLALKNTTRARLRATALKSDFIREAMDQSYSKRIVLILDCCNSGAFAQGTKAIIGGSVGTSSAFGGTGYGRIILTASDSTQFAWEGDKVIGETQNSLFTHFLVKGLEGEADHDYDGRITVDELFDYAYEQIVMRTPKQRPGKWSYKQQGEIVLRQSAHTGNIKPISLPDELIEAIEDSRTFVREGAVGQLEKLAKGKNLGLVHVARETLEKIAAEDDSRRVAQIAAQALETIRQAERLAAQKGEEERLAREKAEAERKAKEEQERLAREKIEAEQKAEAERKAKEEAQRLAAQRAEEERIAREKLEAEQKADADRKAREEAQRLAAQKAKEKRLACEKVEINRKTRAPLITSFQKSYIVIPVAIAALFACIIIVCVFLLTAKSDISSTPIMPGISNLNIPSFSAGEDIYVYFDSDQTYISHKFESRWFLKINILGADSYFPVGYLKNTTNGEKNIYFHLSNPGIVGKYRVDIYMDQKLVGTQSFQIFPR